MMAYWRYIPLGLFLLLSIFLWRGLALDPHQLPSTQINHPLPRFNLPALMPKASPLTQRALQGQLTLLNIWASWCDSCQDEQALLVEVAQQLPIKIVGINYKDDPNSALAWLARFGDPYSQLGQDEEGRFAIELGVYGVPETFLIDAQGQIRHRHAGALTREVWQRDFLPRIRALEGG